MIFARIKRDVRRHFEVRFSEWVLTALGLVVGQALITNDSLFESNAGYAFMARMADEWTWGWCIFLISLVRFCALTANGTVGKFRRFSPTVRSLCAFAHCGVWFVLGASVYRSAPYALLCRVSLVLVFAELVLSLMIAKPAGQAFETPDYGKS